MKLLKKATPARFPTCSRRIFVIKEKVQVMVIDDNEAMTFAIKMLLQDEGFSAFCCSDGRTALAITTHKKFEVYVIDYRMPEITGLQLAAKIRKIHPEAFIIGFSVESKESEFLRAGADTFIAKNKLTEALVPLISERRRLLQNPFPHRDQ